MTATGSPTPPKMAYKDLTPFGYFNIKEDDWRSIHETADEQVRVYKALCNYETSRRTEVQPLNTADNAPKIVDASFEQYSHEQARAKFMGLTAGMVLHKMGVPTTPSKDAATRAKSCVKPEEALQAIACLAQAAG